MTGPATCPTGRHTNPASEKVLALKQKMPDLVILPAHDPTAAARLLGS